MHGPPPPPSADLLRRRRERVLERLGADALVLVSPSVAYRSRDTEHPHRPDSETFYLTGFTEPESVTVLRGHADGDRFVLFVRPRDPEAELWAGERVGPERARERYGADEALPVTALAERLPGLLDGADRVLFRLGRHPTVEPLVLAALERARMRGPRRGVGPRGVLDPGVVLDDLRLVKDADELDRMRTAAAITQAGFRAMMAGVAPGRGEWELEAELEAAFRRAGADGPAYESIVASGPNACVLHYVANARRLEAGDLVLVDAGAAWGLYAADVTRTVPASGAFTPQQKAVYDIVDEARRRAVQAVAPGTDIAHVHFVAVRTLVDGLVTLGLLDGDIDGLVERGAYKPFYPHQTSHWLGLDVHDPGDYAVEGVSRTLEPGMVFTIEPGLYFGPAALEAAGERARRFAGTGIRVEDDVVVTDRGVEVLTAALPTAASEVEALVGG